MADDRLYFKQLLSGHDFAAGDMIASQMRNFAYLIGDRETGDAVVVDPAYAANDLVDALESDGMRLAGVLVTHHHPDHVGGTMMGFTLKGLAELMDRQSVPIHVNTHEAQWVSKITGIPRSDLTAHEHGDRVSVGGIDYTFEPFVLNNTTHNLFKMGDEPAQSHARTNAAAVWATIKLGTTVHISSTAKHDDFYSWKIENNEIAFRPENAGAYAIYRRAVMHVGQEFKTVGKVQIEALQKVFL